MDGESYTPVATTAPPPQTPSLTQIVSGPQNQVLTSPIQNSQPKAPEIQVSKQLTVPIKSSKYKFSNFTKDFNQDAKTFGSKLKKVPIGGWIAIGSIFIAIVLAVVLGVVYGSKNKVETKPTPTRKPCSSNLDCDLKQYCAKDNTCFQLPSCNSGSSALCPVDSSCSNDQCKRFSNLLCSSVSDCPSNTYCDSVSAICIRRSICNTDSDCQLTEQCIQNVCSATAPCNPDGAVKNTCPIGQSCSKDGRCQRNLSCVPTAAGVPDSCPRDAKCVENEEKSGYVCEMYGLCDEQASKPPQACPSGTTCITSTGVCQGFEVCKVDGDCAVNEKCVQNFCVPFDDNCSTNNDCPTGYACNTDKKCVRSAQNCTQNPDICTNAKSTPLPDGSTLNYVCNSTNGLCELANPCSLQNSTDDCPIGYKCTTKSAETGSFCDLVGFCEYNDDKKLACYLSKDKNKGLNVYGICTGQKEGDYCLPLPNTCSETKTQCPDGTKCITNTCQALNECKEDKDCGPPNSYFCNKNENVCYPKKECTKDSDCFDKTFFCDTTTNTCEKKADCGPSQPCPDGYICDVGTCTPDQITPPCPFGFSEDKDSGKCIWGMKHCSKTGCFEQGLNMTKGSISTPLYCSITDQNTDGTCLPCHIDNTCGTNKVCTGPLASSLDSSLVKTGCVLTTDLKSATFSFSLFNSGSDSGSQNFVLNNTIQELGKSNSAFPFQNWPTIPPEDSTTKFTPWMEKSTQLTAVGNLPVDVTLTPPQIKAIKVTNTNNYIFVLLNGEKYEYLQLKAGTTFFMSNNYKPTSTANASIAEGPYSKPPSSECYNTYEDQALSWDGLHFSKNPINADVFYLESSGKSSIFYIKKDISTDIYLCAIRFVWNRGTSAPKSKVFGQATITKLVWLSKSQFKNFKGKYFADQLLPFQPSDTYKNCEANATGPCYGSSNKKHCSGFWEWDGESPDGRSRIADLPYVQVTLSQ